MPFSLTRKANNQIVSTTTPVSTSATYNDSITAVTPSYTANLTTLSIQGVPITITSSQLNYLSVTPGIASPSKALVLNSSRNITGINSISCTALTVNGVSIAGAAVGGSTSPLLSNATPGTATPSQALVLDANNNISNINSTGVNTIKLNNNQIVATKFTPYAAGSSTVITQNMDIPYSFGTTTVLSLNNSLISPPLVYTLWISNMNLYIGIDNLCTIYNSINGLTWSFATGISYVSYNPAALDYTFYFKDWVTYSTTQNLIIIYYSTTANLISTNGTSFTKYNTSFTQNAPCTWCSNLNKFITFSGNLVYSSVDGINWTTVGTAICTNGGVSSPNIYSMNQMVYVPFTNTYLCTYNDYSNYAYVAISTDLLNWVVRLSSTTSYTYNKITLNSSIVIINVLSNSQYSYDCITWTQSNLPPTICVRWDPILLIFMTTQTANTDPYVYYSKDGINWNSINLTGWTTPTYLANTLYITNISSKIFYIICNNNSINTNVKCTATIALVGGATPTTLTLSAKGNIIKSITNQIVTSPYLGTGSSYTCWSPTLNLFVATSSVGLVGIYTSSDGINWTPYMYGKFYINVCWSPTLGIFVAQELSLNKVIISSDGINWKTYTSVMPVSSITSWSTASPMCWVGGSINKFIVVSGTYVLSSTNGYTWTSAASGVNKIFTSVNWYSQLNLLVATSSTGIVTSTNSTTWTSTSTFTTTSFYGTNYSPILNLLVACGNNTTQPFIYSSNGTTWTACNAISSSIIFYSIIWSTGYNLFIASGASYMAISADGISWNLIPIFEPNALTMYNMTWSSSLNIYILPSNNGLIIPQIFKSSPTIGLSGLKYKTTTDISVGTTAVSTWTSQTPPANNAWNSVCWSSELSLFVAVSSSGTGNRAMTSPYGVYWTASTSASDINWSSVCWSSDLTLFVAVSSSAVANCVMTSPDGITWTIRTAINNGWSSICWSSYLSLFVAVASVGSSNGVMTSPDGINWTSRTSANSNNWSSVCWSPDLDLFVAVANSGTTNQVMSSPDGITWTGSSSANTNTWNSVCWSPYLSIFVAVASSVSTNGVMTSSDGITWSTQTSAVANNWSSVCWSSELNMFVTVATSGTGNRIMSSFDGMQWTSNTSAADNSWSSVCWSRELSIFVAVASTGTNNGIMISNMGLCTPYNTTLVTSTQLSLSGLYGLTITSQSSGSLLRLKYNSSSTTYTDFNMNATTNIFNVTCNGTNGIFNIVNHNGTTSGLALNGTVIPVTATQLNYLSVTPGTVSTSKAVVPDSSLNISGINTLTVNKLYVNNALVIRTADNTSPYITDVTPGTASASKALILDSNSSITGINTLGANKIALNNFNVSANNSNYSNINLSNVYNNSKVKKADIINCIKNAFAVTVTTSIINSSIYVPYNNTVVCLNNSNTTSNVSSSADAVTWSNTVNGYITTATGIYTCGAWSPELNTLVCIPKNTGSISYSIFTIPTKSTVALPAANQWSSVCWSATAVLFISVASTGTDNIVMTSPTGAVWTIRTTTGLNNAWNSISASDDLGIIVAVASSGTGNRIMSSTDGINWTARTNPVDNDWTSVKWASNLGLFVAIASTGTNNQVMTSPDGINWTTRTTPGSYSWTCLEWSVELNIFLAGGNNVFIYSFDGINWTLIASPVTITACNSICWSNGYASFIINAVNSTTSVSFKTPVIYPTQLNTCYNTTNVLNFDQINGYLGIGTTANTTTVVPTYKIQLTTDSAGKPSTNTWTISSDMRLKDNIQDADLDICYNNIKNLRLARYTWKDDVYTTDQVSDRSKLGWIADDVEKVFPKAVSKKQAHGYDDCRDLNSDQIMASVYGAAKKLLNNYEANNNTIDDLNKRITEIQNFINTLDIE